MRRVHTLVLAAATLVGVACAGDNGTAPSAPAPVAPSASVAASTSLTCDPTFARSFADARAFFASSSDPVFAALQTMQARYQSGGARGATDAGFEVLRNVAAAHLTSRQGGTAVAGDALTKDVLACMSVGRIPSGFSVVSALTSGIYAVRSETIDPVGGVVALTSVDGQRSVTSPVWGIEPVSSWAGRFDRRQTAFLLYGAPLPVSTFARDPASTDPANVAYTGFDISTIPATPYLTFVRADGSPAPVRVGICIDPAVGGNTNLLVHAGAADTTILRLSSPAFCAAFAGRDVEPHGLLASLARGALSLFAPAPAYALIGGVGGLPSGLSPFGPVKVSVDDITLTFVKQPSNARVGVAISPPIQVRATTENGTPIGGVRITLHVLRGDGSDAGVITGNAETTSDLPSSPGIATFRNLRVAAGGAYRLLATGAMNGQATLTTTSHTFVVKRR